MDEITELRIKLKLNDLLFEDGEITRAEHDRVYLALTGRLTMTQSCGIINAVNDAEVNDGRTQNTARA